MQVNGEGRGEREIGERERGEERGREERERGGEEGGRLTFVLALYPRFHYCIDSYSTH
jgi:hypothetical protein